jgi:hypothetical protein
VTLSSLERVELSGVGDVSGQGFDFADLFLAHSGVGDIDLLNLNGSRLDAVCSGVGNIRLSGTVEEQVVELSGVGDYVAGDLQSARADVTVEDEGDATVRVSDYLKATIRGRGSVYYFGHPTLEPHVTGNGSVVPMGS